MIPYSYLTGAGHQGGGRYVELLEDRLRQLLLPLLGEIHVDEEWYRSTNADVDEAIRAGRLRLAREHYVNAGYFEDRLPHPIAVDEAWYLAEYTDVAEAVRRGTFNSAMHHFIVRGFSEGRLAYAGWSLRSSGRLVERSA